MTETEETTETAEGEVCPPCGLVPVLGQRNDWVHIASTAIKGDTAALLIYEKSSISFGGEAEEGEVPRSVFLLDAERASETGYYKVETSLENVDRVEMEEEGRIALIDTYGGQKEVYSAGMTYMETEEYTYEDPVDTYAANPLVSDRFSRYDYAATDYVWADGRRITNVLAFPHEETLYVGKLPFEDALCGDGKVLLGYMSLDEGKKLAFSVCDVENGVTVNRVESPDGLAEGDAWMNPLGCAIGEDFAVIGIQVTDMESMVGTYLYVWHYRLDAKEELCTMQCFTAEELRAETDAEAASLGEEYGLEIHLDQAPPGYEDYTPPLVIEDEEPMIGGIVTGVVEYDAFYFLTGLRAFLERLPEGMVKELYQNLPNGDELAPLKVYLVEEIHGEAAAFANRYEMYACFASTEYTYDQLPHEFMHLLDARIFAAYDVENGTLGGFYEFWDTLNTPDFGYKYWEDEYEFDPEYFVSSYAMKQAEEDRAEIFMNLFTSASQNETPAWYSEHAPLAHKTDVLLDWIRKAFPSVAKTGKAYWEIIE